MKTEIKVEECKEPFCQIHTSEINKNIQNIADKISMFDVYGKECFLNAWDGDYCIPIKESDIYKVFSMDKKVFVQTEKEILLLKMRLYEFEQLATNCGWTHFIRISNTDIANFTLVQKLDLSLSGIIKVIFKNNTTVNVSRRYMKQIKEKLCLNK